MEDLLVILSCLVLNALFAACEMAFVSIPKPELRRLAREGNPEAARLLRLRENPERTLSIIQVGLSLVAAVSAAVGGAGARETLQPYLQSHLGTSKSTAEVLAILIVVLPLTYLSVMAGELVPKSLALKNPVKIALLGARWLVLADRALAPAVTFLEWSTRHILRLFFPRSSIAAPMPETSVEIDALPQHHQEAVLNLAHIERRRIKDILVPWREVNRIAKSDRMEDVISMVFASGHTRLPVVDADRVVGILHTKEFLAFRETGSHEANAWQSIIRPALRVQAGDALLPVLRLMQSRRNHMAIVVSLRGEPLGIVTLEDISEEIWGDIFDEDDDSRIRQVFADRVKRKMRPRGY